MDRQEERRIALREARVADAAALAEIHIAAWRAAYRGLMPDDYLAALSLDERTKMWASGLARPSPAQSVIAEIDGVAAGFCLFGPSRDEEPPEVAEIYAVNIHPQFWRRGAGRALCEHAAREAAAREHTTLTLWVLRDNQRARRFYESLGFARDGAEKTDTKLIGSPLHDLRYRKDIK
ncbi:MAG TPA: GNAT family N-acetyltransferase [Burkholderiales bacterium]